MYAGGVRASPIAFHLITDYQHFKTSPFLLNELDMVFAEMSLNPSSANDVNQDDHDGDYQKNVDETTHGGGRDQPQNPQNE